MDLASLSLLALAALFGLLALAFVWAVIALGARSIGGLVRVATSKSPKSAIYARFATRSGYVGLIAFAVHTAYTAVYPTDDFYFAEYHTVTSRAPPPEARILAKEATYPDFHGDYCSFSRIEMNSASYTTLLDELATDNRMIRTEGTYVSKGGMLDMKLPPVRVLWHFKRSDAKADHSQTIAFLANGTQVEVQICVT